TPPARRALPRRAPAVPERADRSPAGGAPRRRAQQRPEAVAHSHGGAVGGEVEGGHWATSGSRPGSVSRDRGKLTPGASPRPRGDMPRAEASALTHAH